MQTALAPTLAQTLWPARDDAGTRLLRGIVLVAIGVAALWLSARIKVMVEPVPVTMQVFVVLALGLAYGSRLGFATVMAYLAAGAAGQPVFTNTPEKGLGLAYMMGPTGGYLIGFALAAFAVGWLAERGWDRRWGTAALAVLAGLALIHVFGALWLAYGSPLTAPGLQTAFGGIGFEATLGLAKGFLPVDLVKAALAVALFPALRRLIG